MHRKILLLFLPLLFITLALRAEEGLWLPILLQQQKYADMRRAGLELTPEEIYSVNEACLKDAVIGLMGEGANLKSFCTASFVSDEGLIMTNYHCVMNFIERFSTENNDFLRYGYWASNRAEETFCRGLMIKQLVRMEDVTAEILQGTGSLTGEEKTKRINENGVAIAKRMTDGTNLEGHMQALFGGNQYVISLYRIFKDVRMVAAPPTSIGRFGGHTDNWAWPRHTGDFAFLRVYANAENRPANYNKNNKPYRPDRYLKISLDGLSEGDYAMVMGYPGTTHRYVPSFGLDKIINSENKARIQIAGEKLRILEQAVEENPARRLRYFTRISSTGNKYLRWKGEVSGVRRLNLVERKQEEEQDLLRWIESDPGRRAQYGDMLPAMDSIYKNLAVYNLAFDYFQEAGLNGAEIIPFIGKFEKLIGMYRRGNVRANADRNESNRLIGLTRQFFDNWDYEVDRKIFRNILVHYWENMPERFKPEVMGKYLEQYGGDVEALSLEIFANSIFTKPDSLVAFLEGVKPDGVSIMADDPLYQLAISYYQVNVERIARQRGALQAAMQPYYEQFQRALSEFHSDQILYPDGNSSLRVAYGQVLGVDPEDGLHYTPFTTLDGMIEKHFNHEGNPEFTIPRKLYDLNQARDYGRYADRDGNLPTGFLTSCHTTSGNSGSPVLNGKGELIGLNFDRIRQGVASDYYYDPEVCRNIAVDIRFILFLVEKYAPEAYVLQELKIAGQ